jgi:antitoxin VapB
MALSIKNRKVEDDARELSRVMRKPITEVVGEAISIHLSRAKEVARSVHRDDLLEKVRAIQDRVAALPVLDARHPDEWMYDANGLPK